MLRRTGAISTASLARCATACCAEIIRWDEMRRFTIRDPKPRVIHAPCFRERVLHHALMAQMGPVMDRVLVHDVYACRIGKGAHVAASSVCSSTPALALVCADRHSPVFSEHRPSRCSLGLIARKFSDHDLLALVSRIVGAHEDRAGQGPAHRRADLAEFRQSLPCGCGSAE